jgi:predicted nucleotidyltransferase
MNSISQEVLINIKPSFVNLPDHWQIFERAVIQLAADDRVLGLYLSGSFANGKPDHWSDIDLYIIVEDGQADSIIVEQQKIIASIAPVATSFPATHLGDPHQIIVFTKRVSRFMWTFSIRSCQS